MKKFLLLIFATLSIASCANKSTIRSLNNNNLIDSKQNDDKYTIRFFNDKGTLIESKQYEFGVMPKAPATPSKENPLPEYTYTFSGWSPSLELVTTDADYVATYKAEAKIGKVIWVDGDGETLATDNYAYGSMPNYHGATPTKTPTATESYIFKGWTSAIEVVSKPSTTYTADFDAVPIVPETQYTIQINCTNCLVNKKRSISEKHNPLTDLTYQFNNTSKETYHYPYKLDVTVDGVSTNNYVYDNITGELNIRLTGNTVINAIADNSCVIMKYEYSSSYPTVTITCDGDFESVDWGDGTKNTSKSHTYSSNPDDDIRIFGKLDSIGTTSKGITAVNIFHSVTSIGYRAFYGCSSLTSITIPNSVTSIGGYAFRDCSSLTSITIPNSVTSIGYSVSYDCTSITFYCEAESKPSGWDDNWNSSGCPVVWGYIGNGEYNNLKYGISSIKGIKSIIITGLVDKTVTSVIIPSAINVNGEDIPVTSIGNSAFDDCSSLTSITIPNSVTSIGDFAFYCCSSLVSITIPDSVTSIGYETFYNCSSIKEITIPNSVTSIDNLAFYGCTSITIYCKAESKPSGWANNWNSSCPVVWGYIGNGEYNNLKYGISSIKGIKSIIITGLVDKTVTSVIIPSAINVNGEDIPVTSIGDRAFFGCSSLALLDLSDCDYVVTAGSFFLDGTSDELEIRVKASLVDEYESADNWNEYKGHFIGV